ncbi:hypothetical protein GGG16DRAFT_51271 [Schizophyllum commune]
MLESRPLDPSSGDAAPSVSAAEAGEFMKDASRLSEDEYNALITYLRMTGRMCRDFRDVPHSKGVQVLIPYVKQIHDTKRGDHTFSRRGSHIGNSEIRFRHPHTGLPDTGNIDNIWTTALDGTLSTFIVVRPHQSLSAVEEAKAPYLHCSGFRARIVDADNAATKLVILELRHIVTHLTTLARPTGTYGIHRPTLVVCWGLDRKRQE